MKILLQVRWGEKHTYHFLFQEVATSVLQLLFLAKGVILCCSSEWVNSNIVFHFWDRMMVDEHEINRSLGID